MPAEAIATGTDELLASMHGQVLTLTLNRPDSLNAFTPDMMVALAEQLAAADLNPDVRCLVLTGAGRAFCAGGDVKAMAKRSGDYKKVPIDVSINRQRISQRATAGKLYKFSKPTLAVLPGAAAGAGFSLAMSCDLRLMSSKAVMVTSFAGVGFSGDYGGTLFLSQLVGAAKARELYFLSEKVRAEEALRLGMTNWVAEPDDLADKTKEIAERLANGPTVAFRYMKENIARALASGDVDDCLDLEATHHIHCASTDDHKNAVKAFVEKRAPEFKGH